MPEDRQFTMIFCKFACKRCGLEGKSRVYRREGNEDVIQFMERAVAEAGRVHKKFRPNCTATEVDLKIPIPKPGDGIGMSQDDNPSAEYKQEWKDAINKSKDDEPKK